PHLNALGDDNDGNDDEDGVQIPPLTVGVASNITFDVCGSGAGGAVVEIWIDWHSDGSWDASDLVFSGLLADGPQSVPVMPPGDAVNGPTFARCRISTLGSPGPTGQADDGEVEDHEVDIEGGLKHPVPNLKWSQPPIPIDPNDDFPTYCGWDEKSYYVENAMTGGSTLVYENWDANGWGGYYPPYEGYTVADDISLAGTGRILDHYNFSVAAQVGTAPYTVTSELYTEVIDPCTGQPIPGAPIAGTFCNHNVAVDGYVVLDCSPGSGAILPDNLWLVLTFDTDYAGWYFGEAAELGSTDDVFAEDDGTGWRLYWFSGDPYAGFEANIWTLEEDWGVTVADDFRCIGPMPADSIHWWGSYVGWEDAGGLPPELPIGWRIGFWSNDASGQNCDFLYGAATGTFSGNAPSSLYRIDPATGVATLIGPIGYNGVTGLSFAPDGTLYASANGDAMYGDGWKHAILLTIDTTTGAGTLVGEISNNSLANGAGRMPDISFRANGVLYGYADAGGGGDALWTINTTTGAGSFIGYTGYTGGGNGMDFAPNGTLYATPYDNRSLVIINPATGAGSDVAGTDGNVPDRVNALEFCQQHGVLFGSWKDGNQNSWLVTLDLNTGLALTTVATVQGLDAIAFNEHSRPKELLQVFDVDASRVEMEQVGMDYYYWYYPSDIC
ncbi:MAG: GEVED domain-containing protein, partial [Planctomycetota bacterium]